MQSPYLNDSAAILETEHEEDGTLMKVELGRVESGDNKESLSGRSSGQTSFLYFF
ncbi:hypothetical protein QWY16_11005 [Planococcus shenhongbingii]|uniref:Uncharacterized protein n=1 Tax=Planococcus shenhongbingii TaxID=3058398 RepID=A0ABT8NH10_9BACL|nr:MULTISPECIES: hypothetical protein [unclassified Planococcus (in: firmicutes)]MDN7247183.1 hypothetical protein [Planococcus sp. N017]WKA57037.1 hypothetical protein QWY16_11005 [Planococcus sp. N016]